MYTKEFGMLNDVDTLPLVSKLLKSISASALPLTKEIMAHLEKLR